MKAKPPYDAMIEIAQEASKNNYETLNRIAEKNDAFFTWIIGLAAGAITLILSSIDKLQMFVSIEHLRRVIAFLFLTIIGGVFYRIANNYWAFVVTTIHFYIALRFRLSTDTDLNSQLTGKETYEELHSIVQASSPNQDLSEGLIAYQNASDEYKQILYDSLVKYYIETVAWAKEEFERAQFFVDSVHATALGYKSLEYYRSKQKKDVGILHQRLTKLVNVLYYFTLSSGLISILILSLYILF